MRTADEDEGSARQDASRQIEDPAAGQLGPSHPQREMSVANRFSA